MIDREMFTPLIRNSLSKQCAYSALLFFLLLPVWISSGFAIETPEAPKGFSWMAAEDIQAAFLVPDSWHFWSQQVGNHTAYIISKEGTDGGRSVRTGLKIVVRRGGGKKEGGFVPSAFAAAMLREIKSSRELERSHVGEQGLFATFRFQYTRQEGEEEPIREYNLYIANDATGTLYTIVFSAPLPQWESDRETGEVILQNLIIDDEI